MMLSIVVFILTVATFVVAKVLFDARAYIKYLEAIANATVELNKDEEVVVEHLTMKEIDDLYKLGATSIERDDGTYTIRNSAWNPSTENSRPV